ncbi:MAG: M12 family metallopeptidase [Bacteroidota bacterium]
MKTRTKIIFGYILLAVLAPFWTTAQEEESTTNNTRQVTTKMPFSRGNDVTITVEEENGMLLYQGDIEIERSGRGAAASTDDDFKWPGGSVPYVIASGHPNRADILWAINHINTSTNVCITPRGSEADYVEFIFVSGICGSSRIGKRPAGGRQFIRLGDRCGSKTRGSAAHEIMHALGFYHEQSRDDRDRYVTVNTANIIPGKGHNFEKYNQGIWHYFFPEGQNIGAYDYGSIMHYGPTAFGRISPSTGRPMTTITPKRSGVTIGQLDALSATDIRGINTLYPTACSSGSSSSESSSSTASNDAGDRNETVLSSDESVAIDITYNVNLVPQTSRLSCWAAAAAMIVGWRENLSMNPRDIAGGEGGWGEFFYNNSLPPDNLEMFSIWGLQYEHGQSYTVEGFAQVLAQGPLWAATEVNNGAHVVVVSAMRGDGTPGGTILTIQDPWEEGMTTFRSSNSGSTYTRTYEEFMRDQNALATRELSEPEAYYIAF